MDKKKLLDQIGLKILNALQADARLSYAELGKRVGLSPPAVIERVRRLEEAGIITGYYAEVNLSDVGLPVTAFIQLRCGSERYPKVIALSMSLPEIVECHHVSGGESFVLKVVVESVAALEEIISKLSLYGHTTTSIVLSSPVSTRVALGARSRRTHP